MTGSTYYDLEKASAWRSGGSTQAESRVYNERLILSLIRLHGELSKVELTQLTGLAPQTITSIVNGAAANDLLVRGKPRRGGLGQPSVPYALKASGAGSLGLSIDRDGCDLVLVDFLGGVVDEVRLSLSSLAPLSVIEVIIPAVESMLGRHPDFPAERIAGLGIASPFHGTGWEMHLGLSRELVNLWNRLDLRAQLDRHFSFPVYLLPEGAAAASGELLFGAGLGRSDYLYIHLSDWISGGLVLDHRLFLGGNHLAGTVGEMIVAPLGSPSPPVRLGDVSGFDVLLRLLDGDRARMMSVLARDRELDPAVETWLDGAAPGIAGLVLLVIGLLDISTVVIDGQFSTTIRKALAQKLRRHLARSTANRPQPFSIDEGVFGAHAYVNGAASIPLMFRFASNKDVLLKA